MNKKLLGFGILTILVLAVVSVASASVQTPPLNVETQQYENTLVLITPSNTLLLKAVTTAFKNYAKNKLGVDVDVKLIQAGSPECMNRIIAWNGKPEADIFFGGDLIYHWKLKEKGLLESYKPKSPGYDAIPSTFLGFPLKDPDEMWHPKLWWGHGFMYNTKVLEKLGLQPPKTWDDLLDPKWKDLIVMCTPSRSSSTYINVGIIIQNRGWDQGWAFWRRLAANVGAFVQRSADVVDLVSKGEYAVGFAYSQGAIINRYNGYPVSMYMDPTGFIVSGVSLLKGAPHPNIAKAFLDWWYTEDAQQAALSAGGIPVLPTVKIAGPPNSTAAILREYLGGKDTIYDYLKTFTNVKFYNFTFAEAMYTNISKIFDNTIVAKHSELKDAWSTILSVQAKVKGVPDAEAKLAQAISAFDKGDYATAKALALEAAKIAETAPKGPSATEILVYAVIALVVIAALAYLLRGKLGKKAKQ
ncbi:extracellular solute-binding protein [Thermofilum pendens]|uniref:Extracellular solute-binding protein, family 1 n=1 Tax=Thermofilum pendens (strain DSM 2475 / Hrk 5) TaxID=368408 RepID=A1S0A2_THEPD|nr:extracellular solute-binding protein [Thermofilum pendens]ABL78882.1 extracellular solute-binding protein, family 1 [Thermofilum pendens Hrk 5]